MDKTVQFEIKKEKDKQYKQKTLPKSYNIEMKHGARVDFVMT